MYYRVFMTGHQIHVDYIKHQGLQSHNQVGTPRQVKRNGRMALY